MTYSYKDALTIIKTIEAQAYTLNDWEEEFVENIMNSKAKLSPKQSECLFRIYEKSVSGGYFVKRQYFK